MKSHTPIITPLISVIMSIHNDAKFLTSSLESLRNQNYLNIEIIAIDAASTDSSYHLLKESRKQDTRLKVYRNVKKYGLAITLNRSLRKTKGNFVVFMDPRDMVTRNKFQKQLDFLHANQKVVAVGTQCIYVNEEDKRIGKSNFPSLHEHISQRPLHGISVLFEGIMVSKLRIPKDLLHFPTNSHPFLYSDMALKLIQYGKLANIPEYLQFHRKHDASSLQSTTKHLVSLAKLWLNSRMQYETRPSIRSFFGGAFKTSIS